MTSKAAALLAAQPDFRISAKKAFTSYLRSLQLLPSSKDGVDPVQGLALDEFATSLVLCLSPFCNSATSEE